MRKNTTQKLTARDTTLSMLRGVGVRLVKHYVRTPKPFGVLDIIASDGPSAKMTNIDECNDQLVVK
jgi:hypothetical protein